MLANCCHVELYTIEMHGLYTNNRGIRMPFQPRFFLHKVGYTYNMAACYYNDVNDVTAPHVLAL